MTNQPKSGEGGDNAGICHKHGKVMLHRGMCHDCRNELLPKSYKPVPVIGEGGEFARVAGNEETWYVAVGDLLEIRADDREDAETIKNLLNLAVQEAVGKALEMAADYVEKWMERKGLDIEGGQLEYEIRALAQEGRK